MSAPPRSKSKSKKAREAAPSSGPGVWSRGNLPWHEFHWREFPWLDSEWSRARWSYLIGLGYLLIGYLGTNEFAAMNPWNRPALPIATSIDAALPYVPETVVFYILYYPLLLTPLAFAPSVASLARLTLAQAAMNTFSYIIFILYPTPIERPALPNTPWQFPEDWARAILETLYRADHPYNTFPSLHVAQTALIALFFVRYEAKWFTRPMTSRGMTTVMIVHVTMAGLVAVSAVLIKQHYVADAAAGGIMASIMAWLLWSRRPKHAAASMKA